MALEDDCDKILDYALAQASGIDLADVVRFVPDLTSLQVNLAIQFLLNATPPILRRRGTSDWADLTSDGRQLATGGGYAGLRQREATEQITSQQDRELMRLVNKSVLDTNASILTTNQSIVDTNKSITSTNDSVQKTNQSVQILHTKTEEVFVFQKNTTRVTIFVAFCALGISLVELFKKDESKVNMLPILFEVKQMQRENDSLKTIVSKVAHLDTIPKTHH